jgi:Protein of unknown function (DUF3300)
LLKPSVWFFHHDCHPSTAMSPRFRVGHAIVAALVCAAVGQLAAAQTGAAPPLAGTPVAQAPPHGGSVKIPAEQLDSLVAPIAHFPDPLLAQTLAASTYPLELVQLQQWLKRNPGLRDQALVDAVAKQAWDPSVQSMAAAPEVVDRLARDIQWTTDLGNAYLAQHDDVMAAVQRVRQRAPIP